MKEEILRRHIEQAVNNTTYTLTDEQWESFKTDKEFPVFQAILDAMQEYGDAMSAEIKVNILNNLTNGHE